STVFQAAARSCNGGHRDHLLQKVGYTANGLRIYKNRCFLRWRECCYDRVGMLKHESYFKDLKPTRRRSEAK
ncbi:hypothetical protein OAG38_06205, partial [Akkermansiaceae bacterium]|nr:hypothetical protein [Akkermansiaceae bacterium]